MIIDDYIKYQNKYVKQFGKKTVVLLEVGSFFEYYGIDTEEYKWVYIKEVAAVLDAIVSRKSKKIAHTNKNPLMAGFPNHAIQKHLDKLIKNGWTVILIEQDTHGESNPERKVTGIYSPGTNIQYTQSFNSNNLACLYLETFPFSSLV